MRTALLAALLGTALMAGCGSSDSSKFSDAKIEGALKIHHASTGLQVGDNPLCGIDKILSDADETSSLTKAQQRVAITSKRGNIGVVVITPFAPDCKRDVTAALNHLDRQRKS